MKVEVSLGEAIDKLNILELKMKKIYNSEKRIEIQKEINELNQCEQYKIKYLFFYQLLSFVNEYIWDTTNKIKQLNFTDPSFSILSYNIFEYNQKRFRIKNWFNQLESSNIKEQKSYSLNCIHFTVNSIDTIYNKIPEINYLLLEYDSVYFIHSDSTYTNIMKKIFKQPNLNYKTDNIDNKDNILLDDFILNENRDKFEFMPINYIGGGLLGDFIHQLSIINEYFMETGIKGNIFIANIGDIFRFGIETAYNDTYNLVKEQRYINDYKIYQKNDIINVNLSEWRGSPLITKTNFYNLFKTTYGLEWSKNPWLKLPQNNIWDDKILINYSERRKMCNINFEELNIFKDKLIFIGFEKDGYEDLKSKNINIDYYCPTSLYEFAVAINSCKLFIGGISSPLTLAFACHKNCVVGLDTIDNIWFSNLPYVPYKTKL